MARQYQIPDGPFVNETGTRQYQIPGGAFVNETVAAAGGATVINRRTLGPRIGSRQGGFLDLSLKKD